MITDPIAPKHYTWLEDAQGLLLSTVQCALGIHLLRAAGLVTGGTAGLALLLSYLTGLSFGLIFFAVNLPFYAFAWTLRGPAFAVKSFLSVSAVSALADTLSPWLAVTPAHPATAAILFGIVTGVGLLGLFRHESSLGGVSIVAMILQDKLGIRAGWVQLGFDLALFSAALFVLAPTQMIWSLLGALILNFVIAMNHRRDWYVVT